MNNNMLIADLLKINFNEPEFELTQRMCKLAGVTPQDVNAGDITDQRLKIILALIAVHMGKTAHYGEHTDYLNFNDEEEVLAEQHFNLKRKWARFDHMIKSDVTTYDQLLETLGDLAILAIMAIDAVLKLEQHHQT